jgi:hypothetical protein
VSAREHIFLLPSRPLPRTPRHLFPWLLLAAPAAYVSLRYNAEPEIKPSPSTPSDNGRLPEDHCFLLSNGFEYFGDYSMEIARHTRSFVRLYFAPGGGTHVAVTRTETPVEVFWQTEISTHFDDQSKVTTTNSSVGIPFEIPRRTVFWEPALQRVEDLLASHHRHAAEKQQPPAKRVYAADEYLQELRADIRYDYEALREAGHLRLRKNGLYGLTWKGVFRMLYHQWKVEGPEAKRRDN